MYPMLVQIFLIYYIVFGFISLPKFTFFGFIQFERFFPGVVALALNSGGYMSDVIRGGAAGAENYGNFFAQNCFMGSSGTLLIAGFLSETLKLGETGAIALQVAKWSIPVAVISMVYGIARNLWLDKQLDDASKGGKK